jgi:hypothetical protein
MEARFLSGREPKAENYDGLWIGDTGCGLDTTSLDKILDALSLPAVFYNPSSATRVP